MKSGSTFVAVLALAIFSLLAQVSTASAQAVLFDFDNAQIHSPLPIDQTAGGITAHLSATGQGYSIQEANTMGFTPAGFAGNCIYPNSIELADLLIRFDQALTDFSIMYACQELGCDDAATMRVTAYVNGNYVGTNTRTATNPGTWPTDTLRCSFAQAFDSVVVHYAQRPPTCQDYGVIYLADNMRVTAADTNGVSDQQSGIPLRFSLEQNYPNPFNPATRITFGLPERSVTRLEVFDTNGRMVDLLVCGYEEAGYHTVAWSAAGGSGVYFYRLIAISVGDPAKTTTQMHKMIFMR
jgi:hypothetical protein